MADTEPVAAEAMSRSDRLGHFLVALPIAHILGSALFLWSYCQFFGFRIAAHVGVSDVLAISISDMADVYLWSAIICSYVIAIGIAGNRLQGNPSPENSRIVLWLALAGVVSGGFLLFISPSSSNSNTTLPYTGLYAFSVVVLSAVISGPISKLLGSGRYTQITIEAVFIFISSILLNGAQAGYTDRTAEYKFLARTSTVCKSLAIVRRFGDNYLAVDSQNRRMIMNADCVTKFTVPLR